MLPDEVRKAVEAMDSCMSTLPDMNRRHWAAIKAHLLAREAEVGVLRVKCAGSLANNLCPDHRDKQVGKPCLACTIERAEKRAERAEALLREALPYCDTFPDLLRDGGDEALRRITAHLSENSR